MPARTKQDFRALFHGFPFAYHVGGKKQTTDATVSTLARLNVIPDEMAYVTIYVVGRSDDGTVRCAYTLRGLFHRIGSGNIAQDGSTVVEHSEETDVGLDATLNIDITNQNIRVRVTGLAATTIRWRCYGFATLTPR